MQVGSLVESLITFEIDEFYNEAVPQKGLIYTVRTLNNFPSGVGIRLEEIINPEHDYFQPGMGIIHAEIAFDIKQFRELQPPMIVKIESLIEELV